MVKTVLAYVVFIPQKLSLSRLSFPNKYCRCWCRLCFAKVVVVSRSSSLPRWSLFSSDHL